MPPVMPPMPQMMPQGPGGMLGAPQPPVSPLLLQQAQLALLEQDMPAGLAVPSPAAPPSGDPRRRR